MPTVSTTVTVEGPRAATITSASSKAGNATNTVANDMIASSNQRRDAAAVMPRTVPMTSAIAVASNAASNVVRAPAMMLLSTSRPS